MKLLKRLLGRKSKVFGLGLSKTGTTTLAACMQQLGYKHTSYDEVLLADWAAGRLDRIFRAIDTHDSFDDWPYPLMYSELMERFGANAYYLLTIRRDPRTWIESLKKHALRSPPRNASFRKLAYGYAYPQLNEDGHIAFYERHNSAVVARAAKLGLSDRLRVLCWESGDGWRELCSFLSIEPPTTPFPHENRADQAVHDGEIAAANLRRVQELRLAMPARPETHKLKND